MRRRSKPTIELLAAHRDVLPELQQWFETEWPAHYGLDGPGRALQDLQAFANQGSLPVGVVALRDGVACGVAALLLSALEQEARNLGFPSVFCGTSTAESLLIRCGWQVIERIVHGGQALGIYRKVL